MNECPHCNHLNPDHASTCRVCNLELPRKNQPSIRKVTSKLAVFDLDNTLFDLSRRERVARRQGLKPKSKKWFEFLNQNQYVLMDTAIPGTTNFVRGLSESGYTIAYLSGRPRSVLAATKKSLQQAGFPIDALQEDLIFLHSGNPSKQNLIKHKLDVLTHLKSKFDVDFFFDDTPEFREAAKSLFIPGVYPSISAYTGNDNPRSNPMMSSASSTHAYEQPSRQNPHALVCPKHGIRAPEEIGQNQFGSLICLECGADLKMDGNVRTNISFDNIKKKIRDIRSGRQPAPRSPSMPPMPPMPPTPPMPIDNRTESRKQADAEAKEYMSDRRKRKWSVGVDPSYPVGRDIYSVDGVREPWAQGAGEGIEHYIQRAIAVNALLEAGFTLKDTDEMVSAKFGRTGFAPDWLISLVETRHFLMKYYNGEDADEKINLAIDKGGLSVETFERLYDEWSKVFYNPSRANSEVRSNPTESHWLSMDTNFQMGLGYASAMEWAQALANRDQKDWFVDGDEDRWFVSNKEKPGSIRVTPEGQVLNPPPPRPPRSVIEKARSLGLDYYEDGPFIRNIVPIDSINSRMVAYHLAPGWAILDGKPAPIPDGLLPRVKWSEKGVRMPPPPRANPPPKPRKKRSKSGKMRKEPVKKYVERFMGDKKMNEEFPDRAQRFAVGLSYAREFYGNSTVDRNYPPRDVVRTNPGTVAEAKEMYKKFHQKNPSHVKKKKIDIGDTWVGLGKAWSIGYRSGKETGDSNQKYIHNFGVDEESGKKFKEPDLYYVKNKDGSQMMVIMGGDWYIDVDSDGKVSWIYI